MRFQRVTSEKPTAPPDPENGTAVPGVGPRNGGKSKGNRQEASKGKRYSGTVIASTAIETRLAALRRALEQVPTGSPAAYAYESAIARLQAEGGSA